MCKQFERRLRDMSISKLGQTQGIGGYDTKSTQTEKLQESGNDKGSIFTRNDAKAWKKSYREQTGATRKEANAAFNEQFEKLDKMSRKDAKAWVKNYRQEHNCSKKEAKAAFKEEFGYDVPLSKLTQALRYYSSGLVGILAVHADINNDAAYVKKQEE